MTLCQRIVLFSPMPMPTDVKRIFRNGLVCLEKSKITVELLVIFAIAMVSISIIQMSIFLNNISRLNSFILNISIYYYRSMDS